MKAIEIRNNFLNYFKENGHSIIESASLLPENDSSVLFTTAGMQQLEPYLLGKKHPQGNKLADFQKCLRTVDIDEVGDNRHLTFFEMLGNWSLGAYFKKEAITYTFEVLTKVLKLPIEKLSVTCFKGDENSPKDVEAAEQWEKLGIPKNKIYFCSKEDNWWIAGEMGPCGADTEIFYDMGENDCKNPKCDPTCDCGRYVEIWNNVFMQYFKDESGYTMLKQKNVDTGMGLERIAMILQKKKNPFELDIFENIMKFIEDNTKAVESAELPLEEIKRSQRIVADHLRTSSMLISDGAMPSNVDRGYILRRLIRRAIRHLKRLEFDLNNIDSLINIIIKEQSELYSQLLRDKEKIIDIVNLEIKKFLNVYIRGEKEFEKLINRNSKLDANSIFKLYETYGFPIETSLELAKEKKIQIDENEKKELDKLFKEHQEKSRMGSDKKFKGGLLNHNKKTVQYHTATHLLHKALQVILGKDAL